MIRNCVHPVAVLLPVAALLAAAFAAPPATTPPATTSAPATLPAVPAAADHAAAVKLVRELYKQDFNKTAVADRIALARKLLADGLATRDSLAARHALFVESLDLAVSAGDSAGIIKAVDALAAHFAGVDALDLKCRHLARANAPRQAAAAHEALAGIAVELTYAAVAAGRMDLAEQFAVTADQAAQKATRVAVVTSIRARLADYRTIAGEFARTREPREALKLTPDDSDACARVGRFDGLYRGDWAAAIPLLARGNDAVLKSLAERDAANPADAIAQGALGNGWWEYAATVTGIPRSHAARRAIYWYNRALPDTSGMTRTLIQSRIKATEPGPSETQPARLDLLPLVDAGKDAVEGTWKLENGALNCQKLSYSRIQLPVIAPEEYDFRVTFARLEGDGPVSILLTGGSDAARPFGWTMDVQGNESRFETVDGKIKSGNPTTVKFRLENDRRYSVLVRVRRDGVAAFVDDKLIAEHKTDFKELSRYSRWKLPDNHHLGLGASARTVFFKVELVAVSGDYRKTREK